MRPTDRPRKVAIFSDALLPKVDGVALTVDRLAGHLRRRGWGVALVGPRPIQPPPSGVDLLLELPSLPIPFYAEGRAAWGPGRRQVAALSEFDPDVVHVVTEFTVGWSGRRFARRHRIPLVTSSHTDYPAFFQSWGMGLLGPAVWSVMRASHRPALTTLVPSLVHAERLSAHGVGDHYTLWSRGVDADVFNPAHRSEALRQRWGPGAEHILLFVGRICPEKRVDLLLDAFARIRRARGSRVSLVLVGDGPSTDRLRQRQQPGVHFTGYLRGAELSAAYAAGDVFLFPSDTETFGNVVLEAMASGMPAVVPDRGGVTEIVRHGKNGLIAETGSADSFASQCLSLLEDATARRRLAAQARRDAAARRWSPILDEALAVYREAARG